MLLRAATAGCWLLLERGNPKQAGMGGTEGAPTTAIPDPRAMSQPTTEVIVLGCTPRAATSKVCMRQCQTNCLANCLSPPSELRFPSFPEGRDRFLMVGARVGLFLESEASVHDRGCELLEADVDGGLGGADRNECSDGKPVDEGVDPRIELGRGDGVIDETHARGFGRGDQIAGHQKFLGSGIADQL